MVVCSVQLISSLDRKSEKVSSRCLLYFPAAVLVSQRHEGGTEHQYGGSTLDSKFVQIISSNIRTLGKRTDLEECLLF